MLHPSLRYQPNVQKALIVRGPRRYNNGLTAINAWNANQAAINAYNATQNNTPSGGTSSQGTPPAPTA